MKKRKIVQFKFAMAQEGGGERVMRAIRETLGAEIYTILNETKDKRIKEISTTLERQVAALIVKE